MIYSIGEMLIDFMQETNHYIPYPGGAPANVAIHAKRAGSNSYFVGKLSQDAMGDLLSQNLRDNKVYFDLERTHKPTALALVSHIEGDRSFQFYRKDTADLHLGTEDIDAIEFKENDLLHFCSLGLVPDHTTRIAHRYAINKCKEAKGIISFDVNLRAALWENLDEAKVIIKNFIECADLVKVNEEELLWLTGTDVIEDGLKQIQTQHQTVICTVGSKGSVALLPDQTLLSQKATPANQVDTTGAGDAFIAMILHKLEQSNQPYSEWIHDNLQEAMAYASAISAKVVQHQGATPTIEY